MHVFALDGPRVAIGKRALLRKGLLVHRLLCDKVVKCWIFIDSLLLYDLYFWLGKLLTSLYELI